ncbi:MAG TPA: glucosaminidase domain-containing protein [Bacteroidia bacterium]|nr:glucosaminidase domain-containing protein [Bacteroidia bacterium]
MAFTSLSCKAYHTSFSGTENKNRYTPSDYISMYVEYAVRDMHKTGVPASITLAQGMLESEFGNSSLAKEANNHFGIKCHKEWFGPTYTMDDDAKDECFRKYNSVYDSYDDHSNFLRTRQRYADLFTLELTDYKGWAKGLKKAGYATNPHYADKLIELIERYDLNKFDKVSSSAAANGYTWKNEEKKNFKEEKEKENDIPLFPETTIDISNNEVNYTENNVPFVLAKEGDSYLKIAARMDLRLWQMVKYNDSDKDHRLKKGEVVFIKPKRSKGLKDQHVLGANESMWYVSQKYAIRLDKLYKRNGIEPGAKVKAGTVIKLR